MKMFIILNIKYFSVHLNSVPRFMAVDQLLFFIQGIRCILCTLKNKTSSITFSTLQYVNYYTPLIHQHQIIPIRRLSQIKRFFVEKII